MSDDFPGLDTFAESDEDEALADWFAEQRLHSVDNLESAARQIITLCTTLLGALFSLMALAEGSLPQFMQGAVPRWISGGAVFMLFLALAAALAVELPRANRVGLSDSEGMKEAFNEMLRYKNSWLQRAIWLFAAGMLCIMATVVFALVLTE